MRIAGHVISVAILLKLELWVVNLVGCRRSHRTGNPRRSGDTLSVEHWMQWLLDLR